MRPLKSILWSVPIFQIAVLIFIMVLQIVKFGLPDLTISHIDSNEPKIDEEISLKQL